LEKPTRRKIQGDYKAKNLRAEGPTGGGSQDDLQKDEGPCMWRKSRAIVVAGGKKLI